MPDYETRLFKNADAWRKWLAKHHATTPGIWLQVAKVSSSVASVSISDALDVALCYGWIDGQRKSLDEQTYLQKFTPRGKRSIWSKRNREHVARLIASGDMQPSGLAAVEAAKADGRWDRAYDSSASATVPADFLAVLNQNAKAKRFFESLSAANRYAVLWRIQTAVKAETRARRIVQLSEMLARGETFHQ